MHVTLLVNERHSALIFSILTVATAALGVFLGRVSNGSFAEILLLFGTFVGGLVGVMFGLWAAATGAASLVAGLLIGTVIGVGATLIGFAVAEA